MPHIFVDGCDMEKNIERILIHADIDFSEHYFNTLNARLKMQELEEELSAVVKKYFPTADTNVLSNHEYNIKMNKRI